MRLDIAWTQDGRARQHCVRCREEAVARVIVGGRTYYDCRSCGVRSDRSIVIDPAIRWWLGTDGEYWHESSGVFLADTAGRFLFFRRTIFPFVLTVPAGHVDAGEEPSAAARREVLEETGLRVDVLEPVGVDDILGDSCRRGSDAHRWNAFRADVGLRPRVRLGDEGQEPQWLSVPEALDEDLAVPVRLVVEKYRHALTN